MGIMEPTRMRTNPVALSASPAKANLVFYQLQDNVGQILAMLVARYNGQLEDAVTKAKKLENMMQKVYPIQTDNLVLIGAFDSDGMERWTIAPNLKQVFMTGTKDAFLCRGEAYECACAG